jgi:multimeric flavodoxin WrbA
MPSWKNGRDATLIKLLSVCGSPVQNGSTEILLRWVARSFSACLGNGRRVDHAFVRLNELRFIPCQSCGKAPSPKFCFYDDDLTPLYDKLAVCDCLLFGSPVYFDSVSAQAKMFIDRCNCFRPPDFDNVDPRHDFLRQIKRKRAGAIVLVGGEEGWYEGARRCIAGFFKWLEVVNEGVLVGHSRGFQVGSAVSGLQKAEEAGRLGRHLASVMVERYEQQ